MGEIDDDDKVNPYKLTFVYKTGFKDGLNGEDFKSSRKNAKKKNKFIGKNFAELYSYINNQVNKSCPLNTCGDSRVDTKGNFVEILRFKHFYDHFVFTKDEHNFKKKAF